MKQQIIGLMRRIVNQTAWEKMLNQENNSDHKSVSESNTKWSSKRKIQLTSLISRIFPPFKGLVLPGNDLPNCFLSAQKPCLPLTCARKETLLRPCNEKEEDKQNNTQTFVHKIERASLPDFDASIPYHFENQQESECWKQLKLQSDFITLKLSFAFSGISVCRRRDFTASQCKRWRLRKQKNLHLRTCHLMDCVFMKNLIGRMIVFLSPSPFRKNFLTNRFWKYLPRHQWSTVLPAKQI